MVVPTANQAVLVTISAKSGAETSREKLLSDSLAVSS